MLLGKLNSMQNNDDAVEYFKKKILRDLEKDIVEEHQYQDRLKAKSLTEKLRTKNYS